MGHRPERERRALVASRWLYQRLLSLYPAPFRQTFGPEMVQVFTASCRAALGSRGLAGLLPFWAAIVYDLIKTALGEHLRTRRIAMTRRVVVRLCGAMTLACAVETAFDRIDTTYFGSFWGYISYYLGMTNDMLEASIPVAALIAGCGGLCVVLAPRLGGWSWSLVISFIGAVGGAASLWWIVYVAPMNDGAFVFSLRSRVAVIPGVGYLLITVGLFASAAISAGRHLPTRWVTLLAALGLASVLLLVMPLWIGSFVLSPPVPLLFADRVRIYLPLATSTSDVLVPAQLVLTTGFDGLWALLGAWLWSAVGRVGHLESATSPQPNLAQ
jgi:hypothetical protein